MGLGYRLKAKTGGFKLEESLLNRYTIYLLLRKGSFPVIATLPIVEQKRRNDTMIYFDGHGHGRTFDNPLLGDNTKMRKVRTHLQCNSQQLIVQHAFADGRHFFIDASAVARVGKIKNGIWLEVADGRKFIFEFDKKIRNDPWKALGFNPQFPLDVLYNLFVVPGTWSKAFINEYRCPKCNHTFVGQLPKCPNCDNPLGYGEF